VNPAPLIHPVRAAVLLLGLALAGCSTLTDSTGERYDYRSQAGKTAQLEVPPDLTQLARDSRYQPQSGAVSANALRQQQAAQPAAGAGSTVAAQALGDLRIERQGNVRWLVTNLPADKLYPLVRSFWAERGFTLAIDNAEIGVMETDWAENRARIPQDIVRRTIGKVFDNLFSTPERDRFRTRIERTATGTEVYISHRGMQEVYITEAKDQTIWQPRPSDPEMEAEFLSRLMVKLGAKEDSARTAVASATPAPAKARPAALPDNAAMELDEGFDRAWRQVGLALDRSGFTVEDRDRSAGLYFVRYVDPKLAGKEDPNFFQRLFSSEKDTRPQRLRVLVKAAGAKTQVTVQNADGAPDNGPAARAIIGKLVESLK